MDGGAHERTWPERLGARLARSAREGILAWFRELFWPRDASKVYAVVALLAVASPWVHQYPVGIDLPMHVHLFQVLARWSDPETAYRVFYRLDFYTPYAVVYLLGWLFAEIGGALFSIKVVLSLCILTLPATMTRWLRVIGGDPRLGILGFALVFGYGYLWGFVSFVLSASVSFAYLAELGELLRKPSWKRRASCAALAVFLFFTHGIGFGFTMICGGLICLLRKVKPKAIALDLLHFLPVLAVVIPWRFRQERPTSQPFEQWPEVDRFTSLFSGSVSSQADFFPALSGLAAVCAFFILLRPRLSYAPERFVPWALGLLGLFVVPEVASDTFLVGTRFVQFVYFFGVGAVDFPEAFTSERRVRFVSAALALLGACTFHYRMFVFNRELDGLDRVQALIPPGGDVRLITGNAWSTAFGSIAHRNVIAYITASQGGFLSPDNTHYFQIPVQPRADVPGPEELRYWVTRGNRREARREVGKGPKEVASFGRFHLFEPALTVLEVPGLQFVRFGQNWRKPQQNKSVDGEPLRVGGQLFDRGIGSHVQSVLQFHPQSGVKRLRGKFGMDDGGDRGSAGVFRILDAKRRKLFESSPLRVGDPAASFDVSLEGIAGDVFLMIGSHGNVSGAHADWLELEAVP